MVPDPIKPKITIVWPHLNKPENNKALEINMAMLFANTFHEFDLKLNNNRGGEYYRLVNRLVEEATTEYVMLHTTDVFLAPGWDIPMLKAAGPNRIVNGVVVEPGAMGVFADNFQRDFGMTPEEFRRKDFERFCLSDQAPQPVGRGWYSPALIHRQSFLEAGGFDTSKGRWPTEALDSLFWDTWVESGRYVIRVPSYAYHLQNWSNEREQEKRKVMR